MKTHGLFGSEKRKGSARGVRMTAYAAFLAALGIVLGKYLQIPIGNSIRISFENLPVIFAGAAFGAPVGALVGATADLVGSFLVGYAVNPIITLGAALVGAASGLVASVGRRCGLPLAANVFLSSFAAHAIGSLAVKTVGLYVYYGAPSGFRILLASRAAVYMPLAAIEGLLIFTLLKNRYIFALTRFSRVRNGGSTESTQSGENDGDEASRFDGDI